ncbi:MAG: PD40 domain-containing protein [Candidatus Sericytochromatia bacterium]|nr:PD40 domain-containing protein [Candidatus Tanganyikabacteria bacterium]
MPFAPLLAMIAASVLLAAAATPGVPEPLHHPAEKRLSNVRKLTSGGQNAEAYFSADGARIVFQATRPPHGCDQIYTMDLSGGAMRRLSSGEGRTTCSFFLPDGKRFVYASTHLGGPNCPAPPDNRLGYVWPLFPDYDIFLGDLGGGAHRRLTDTPGYDAEAAVSPDGRRVVFTSVRDGDLEIYSMNSDGTDVRRLTHRKGFDGGPFYSWDGKHIVYRSHYPDTPEALAEYEGLLAQNLMRPTRAEVYLMNADGSGQTQVTRTGHANWSPFMHPDGRRIVFSSNMHDPRGRTFSLYMINTDGTGLERVTYGARFDSFPMFSRDGTRLLFSSSRAATEAREFNVFLADWQP